MIDWLKDFWQDIDPQPADVFSAIALARLWLAIYELGGML